MINYFLNIKKNGVWYLHLHSKIARVFIISILMCILTIATTYIIGLFTHNVSNIGNDEIVSANSNNYVYSASYYKLQTSPPYTIALDSGHGGIDTGALGIITEVDVCDTTTKYLYDFLDKDPNYKPILTHDFGEDLSTTDRALNSDINKASLLLSIHANYDASSSQSHGFEAFAAPPGRYYHTESLLFATYIAQGMGEAGHRLRGENGVRYAYYSSDGNSKKIVESSVLDVRENKSFGMLEKPLCPAVLVEQCFLSNENDTQNWATPQGCLKAANIYYKAICKYYNTTPIF